MLFKPAILAALITSLLATAGEAFRCVAEPDMKADPGISMMITPWNLIDFSCVSGFNYDGKHIVTVNHLYSPMGLFTDWSRDRAPPLVYCDTGNRSFRATKVGSNPEHDIAVYRIKGDGHYFDHSFSELPDAYQDNSWRISFAESLTVAGVDFGKFEMASVNNFCVVSLVTPKRYYCLGNLNTKSGYSGSPVFVEKESTCMTVGMLSSVFINLLTGEEIVNIYIRSRIIHQVVQRIIENSPFN